MGSWDNDWLYAYEVTPDGPWDSFRIEIGHQKNQPHDYRVESLS